MQFTVSFLDHEIKMIRTIDTYGVDAELMMDLFALDYPNSEIIKVVPHPQGKESE